MTYEELGQEIGKLVDTKNAAYGSSFDRSGEILAILYPNGVTPKQYVDVLATARILDKLFRIASNPDAFGESPYADLAGYGILGAMRNKKEQ